MSSKEIKDEINYDDPIKSSNEINDISLNSFNNDFKRFGISVIFIFISILIWGILGTTCIFWLKHATTTFVNLKNAKCYKNGGGSLNFLDIYFPYDKDYLPYKLQKGEGCETLNPVGSIPKIKDNLCDNPFNGLKGTGSTTIELVKKVDFPYNYFSNIKDLEEIINNESASDTSRYWNLLKKISIQGWLYSFVNSRYALHKIFEQTNNNNQLPLPSFLILFLSQIIFAIIIFIKFFVSLFSPIAHIFKSIYSNELYTYLFKFTSILINSTKDNYNNSNSENLIEGIIKFFKTLLLIFISFLTIPIDLFIMGTLLIIACLITCPITGSIFIISLLSIFIQPFKLIEGAFKSGKFVDIFTCNSQLLLLLFGFFVTYSANKYLDPSISPFIATSYALYIIHSIVKFLMS